MIERFARLGIGFLAAIRAMRLHALGNQKVERSPFELVGCRKGTPFCLILCRKFEQFLAHSGPLLHELRSAGISAAISRILDRLAHIDDFADLASALHRDGDREVPDVIREVFE